MLVKANAEFNEISQWGKQVHEQIHLVFDKGSIATFKTTLKI